MRLMFVYELVTEFNYRDIKLVRFSFWQLNPLK